MRVRDAGVVVAGFLVASGLTVSPALAEGGFGGQWAATDGDGSTLSLSIQGAGQRYAVREVDDAATVCGGAPATVSGAGRVEGETLVVPTTLACLPGGNVFRHRIVLTFGYDAATDTLTDNEGVVWSRVG